jgi:hypothetical protein
MSVTEREERDPRVCVLTFVIFVAYRDGFYGLTFDDLPRSGFSPSASEEHIGVGDSGVERSGG